MLCTWMSIKPAENPIKDLKDIEIWTGKHVETINRTQQQSSEYFSS